MEKTHLDKESSKEGNLALDSSVIKTSSSGESSHSKEANVVRKSYGIRRSELIIGELRSWWIRGSFFFSIFLAMYISSIELVALRVFSGYATDSYRQHSLLSTIRTVQSVVAAGSLPFFARLSDHFGRLELFLVAVVFRVVGTIIQWQATNVQRYAAGVVFSGFGGSGMRILLQVNLADASSLRWRLAAMGVANMTPIITTWSSGELVNSILENHHWKFGIAMWAFVLPLGCVPYILFYIVLAFKASKTDEWKEIRQEQRGNFLKNHPKAKRHHDEIKASTSKVGKVVGHLKYASVRGRVALHEMFWKIDFVGCLLVVVTFGLILVPLTLAGGTSISGTGDKWKRASTVVPLVLGFCTIGLFIIWELKITKIPMLPFPVMKNRGVWAAFLAGVFSTLITGLPNGYSYPVLLVGMNATPTVATRTPTLSGFVGALALPILGFIVSRVRRSKGFILFGNCVMFIAMGLFIHFRGSNDGLRAKYFRDGVAISVCIMGFASVFFYRLVLVSVQACTNHEYMAVVSALFSSFYQVGVAMSNAVSGAIWTQTMYKAIYNQMEKLGVDTSLAKPAYESPYRFVQMYSWGTNPRRAVSMAYAEVQRNLAITGLCLCVPMLVWVLLLRDHRLSDAQNLDDEAAADGSASESGQQAKSRVTFTDDKDVVLDFVKRLVKRK